MIYIFAIGIISPFERICYVFDVYVQIVHGKSENQFDFLEGTVITWHRKVYQYCYNFRRGL